MLESLDAGLVMAGLIDLDGTFIIQLVAFLVFFLMLYTLVVKPMTAAHELRYKRMEGARKDAEAMDLRAGEALQNYEHQLDSARQTAVKARDDIKASAESDRRDQLDAARKTANAASDKHGAELADSVAKVRAELDTKSDELAEAIVARLLPGVK